MKYLWVFLSIIILTVAVFNSNSYDIKELLLMLAMSFWCMFVAILQQLSERK